MVTVRPDFRAYRAGLATGVIGGGAAMSIGVNFARDPVGGAIVVVATLLLIAGGFFLYFRNVRVEIQPDTVSLHGMFGQVRRWQRSEVVGCTVRALRLTTSPKPIPMLIVYGEQRRTLFTLRARYWRADASVQISQALAHRSGLSTDHARVMSRADLSAEFPGSVPFTMRHPWLIGGGGALVAIAGIVLLVLAFNVLKTGHP